MSVLSELVGALQILPDDRDGREFFNRIGQERSSKLDSKYKCYSDVGNVA